MLHSKSCETSHWKSDTHGGCFPRSSGFADFEDEYVKLDLPHIPEATRSEMTKELELRFQQLQILLQTFHNNKDRTDRGGVVRATEATRTCVYARTPEV